MKITHVEVIAVSIPLPAPVSDAVRFITHRDHLIVTIRTDEGLEGTGFTLGYDGSLAMIALVDAIYRPVLLGANPFETERLWAEMYRQSIQAGRRGAAMRAISAIDIALWDLKGKAARMPVMDLLGVYTDRLRCYATGGYYRKGLTTDELVREMAAYVEKGFTAIKLKVGKASPREDAERMRAVRRGIGEDVDLLLDANGGWSSAPQAIAAMRRLEESRPYWIEEPVRADNVHAMAQIAAALDTPVATGELESTRWAFADLVERKAADILQADVTVVGGVSEWMKVAHMAASFDVPMAPHYNQDLHSQLVPAIPNGIFLEFFVRESGVKMFDDLLEDPLVMKDGFVTPRREPGFGIRLRPEKVSEFRIG